MHVIGRLPLGDTMIDLHTLDSAVERIATMTGSGVRLVVTPNLDHLVRLRKHQEFRDLYEHADLVLGDGTIISWLAHLSGQQLPEVLTGVDVFDRLCRTQRPRRLRVFLLGGRADSNAAATRVLARDPYCVDIVGSFDGMVDAFEQDSQLLAMLHEAQPDVVAVCLGSPKQEQWVVTNRDLLPSAVYMGLGATLSFLGGTNPRAPRWMQKAGLEWVHRLADDPKRLWKRYAEDAMHLPALLLQALVRRFRRPAVTVPAAVITIPTQPLDQPSVTSDAWSLDERELA